MNNFNELYNKIINEATFDKTQAQKTAAESNDPKELGELFNKVYTELGVNDGTDILLTLANNKYLATWTMKKLSECGGNIQKQLFLTLDKKENRVPSELIEAQDKYIKNNNLKIKSLKDLNSK